MGDSSQSPALGSIASAARRRDRHGGVATSRSSRCEHQLAGPMLGQVSVFRVNMAEKRGWEEGYVSTFRGDVAAARGKRVEPLADSNPRPLVAILAKTSRRLTQRERDVLA